MSDKITQEKRAFSTQLTALANQCQAADAAVAAILRAEGCGVGWAAFARHCAATNHTAGLAALAAARSAEGKFRRLAAKQWAHQKQHSS